MTPPSVRAASPHEQDAELVPDRMDLVGEWVTPEDDHVELYADRSIGDGLLLAVARRETEIVGVIDLLDGQVRSVEWRGSWRDRPGLWRNAQRARAAALVAEEAVS